MLIGANFDVIPDSAKGVWATNNNAPEEYKNVVNDAYMYEIVEKTESRMVLRQIREVSHSVRSYLGGIYSNDRSVTYWVNNTRPLP